MSDNVVKRMSKSLNIKASTSQLETKDNNVNDGEAGFNKPKFVAMRKLKSINSQVAPDTSTASKLSTSSLTNDSPSSLSSNSPTSPTNQDVQGTAELRQMKKDCDPQFSRFADYFVICGLDLDTGLEPDRFAGNVHKIFYNCLYGPVLKLEIFLRRQSTMFPFGSGI